MNKRFFLFLLVMLYIFLGGCASSNRPIDLSGNATPTNEFLKRKVAIEYPKLQKVTPCPLEEFLKAMKPGKWMKMSEAQWLYNMKNEKFDIYVLFTKHPLHQDVVLFQKVIINGRDVSEDGLVTLFRFTLSELGLDVIKNNDVSSEGVLTLFRVDSSENAKAPAAPSVEVKEAVAASSDASTEDRVNHKTETINENNVLPLPSEEKKSEISKKSNGPAFSAVLQTPQIQNESESAKVLPKKASTEKVRVVGNRDSKLYHLPGMKYYSAVKAYHRVIFESEADAIKAGYSKAPR